MNTHEEIPGVVLQELKSHADDRGFFRELIRKTDPFFAEGFGQWSHSRMSRNTVKAWHFHHQQIDWWYIPTGLVHVALVDNRQESPTYRQKLELYLGDPKADPRISTLVVKIPQGVLHGCKVLSESADLFYITSHTYNPDDEGRIPFDSPEVPHSWGDPSQLIVVERDRKAFTPPFPRRALTR